MSIRKALMLLGIGVAQGNYNKKVRSFISLVAILLNFSSEAGLPKNAYYYIEECFGENEQHLNLTCGITRSKIVENMRWLDSTYALDCKARRDPNAGLLCTNKGITPSGQLCIYLFPSSGIQFCIENHDGRVLSKIAKGNGIPAPKIVVLFYKIAALTRKTPASGAGHDVLVLYDLMKAAESDPEGEPDKQAIVAQGIYSNVNVVPAKNSKAKDKIAKKFSEKLGTLDILDGRILEKEEVGKIVSRCCQAVIESVRTEEAFYQKYWTEFLIHRFAYFFLSSTEELKILVGEMERLGLITCDSSKIARIGEKPSEEYFAGLTEFSTSQAVDFITSHSIRKTPYDDGVTPQSCEMYNAEKDQYFSDCVETAIRALLCILFYNSETEKFYELPDSVPPGTRKLFEEEVSEVVNDRNIKIRQAFATLLGSFPSTAGVKYRPNSSIISGALNLIKVLTLAFNLPVDEIAEFTSNPDASQNVAKSLENCLNQLVRLVRQDVTISMSNAKEKRIIKDKDYALESTVEAKNETNEKLYSFTLSIGKRHTEIANIINGNGENSQLLQVVQAKHTPKTIFDSIVMYDPFYIIRKGADYDYKDKYIDFLTTRANASPLVNLMFSANFDDNLSDSGMLQLRLFLSIENREPLSFGIGRNYMYAISKRIGHRFENLEWSLMKLSSKYTTRSTSLAPMFDKLVVLYSDIKEEKLKYFIEDMTESCGYNAESLRQDPILLENYTSSPGKSFSEKETLLNIINGGTSGSLSSSGASSSSSSSSSDADGAQ